MHTRGITKPSFEMNTKRRKRQRWLPLCAAFALAALGFSSTVALVPHDHLLAVLESAECVTEHESSIEQAAGLGRLATPVLEPLAIDGHEHDCVGCQFSRSRSTLVAWFQLADPVLDLEGRLLGESQSFETSTVSGQSARGPPRA